MEERAGRGPEEGSAAGEEVKNDLPSRATWFKFFGQRYLVGGSLRLECQPDERAVWIDFLSLANAGDGKFDIGNRRGLAVQLMISPELLERAIKKFIAAGRITIRYNRVEKKETVHIVKWRFYQQPARPHRKKEDGESSPQTPLKKEEKKERKIDRERGGSKTAASFSQKGSKTASLSSPENPLPPIPNRLSDFDERKRLEKMRSAIFDREKILEAAPNSLKGRQDEAGRMLTAETLKADIEVRKKEYVARIKGLGY